MRLWAILILLVCGSCFLLPSQSRGQEAEQAIASSAVLPRPNGPVSDGADIIPATDEARLDTRLRAILDETQSALIVVTVSSLDGHDPAAYTNALARAWKVGSTRGGVVLLVAPNERQVRIETDDMVRARLSDRQCAEIIEKVLLPRFRTGDFAGGIAVGVEAIASRL